MNFFKKIADNPFLLDHGIRFCVLGLMVSLVLGKALLAVFVTLGLLLWIIKRVLLIPKLSQLKLQSLAPAKNFLNNEVYLFTLVSFFSIFSSFFFSHSLSSFFSKTFEAIIIFFLATDVLKSEKDFQAVVKVHYLTGFALIVNCLIQYYITGFDLFLGYEINAHDGRLCGSFKSANILGAYLCLFIPFLTVMMLMNKKWRSGVNGLLLVASWWCLYLTESRGALVAVALTYLIILFWYLKINRLLSKILGSTKKILLFFGVLLLLTGVLFKQPIYDYFLDNTNRPLTVSWRLQIWTESLAMIKDRPLLGHGVNTFMQLFQGYRVDRGASPTYAHNSFIQMAVEVGLLGLGVFLFMVFKMFVKLRNVFKSNYQVFCPSLTFALVAFGFSLFAFLIHSFFDNNLYALKLRIAYWLYFGITASLIYYLNSYQQNKLTRGNQSV